MRKLSALFVHFPYIHSPPTLELVAPGTTSSLSQAVPKIHEATLVHLGGTRLEPCCSASCPSCQHMGLKMTVGITEPRYESAGRA